MASTDPAHLPVDLLKPYPAEELKVWKVGRAVGNTRNNDASLVEPLSSPVFEKRKGHFQKVPTSVRCSQGSSATGNRS
jgi:hypothetical protein